MTLANLSRTRVSPSVRVSDLVVEFIDYLTYDEIITFIAVIRSEIGDSVFDDKLLELANEGR